MYKISTKKESGINLYEGINLDATFANKSALEFNDRETVLILKAVKDLISS
jgi:hypothetical protein